jgi:hypothetical protein
VLVEGASDAAAVTAFAERRGVDLTDAGIAVLSAGGVTKFGTVLARLRDMPGLERVVGLYDEAEGRHVVQAIRRSGYSVAVARVELEDLGFFVCVADLEDELIRALGPRSVELVLEAEGELRSFRIFENQPAQRDRQIDQQLRRFMGTRSLRKVRYGRLLVEALDVERVPSPLRRLLDRVCGLP